MSDLMQIREFIQAYVEAVSSILEADVTVIDNQLIRVGGTGIYAQEVGQKISHDSFFESVLINKKPGVIRDVRKEFLCNYCEKRDTCKELANLAYPILLEGEAVGVIGVIAFSEKERERLLQNHDKLENFVKYMSVLIESKIITHRRSIKLERQINEVIREESKNLISSVLIGRDEKIGQIISLVHKIAPSDSTVLLSGESGTGKEVIAKLIHTLSTRKDHLMITVNCSAIPENLVESELFGYEEGAFTGAKKGGHMGKFELANNSTLFLDEIGEMPMHIQTKLLRVLQEGQVERIGGKRPILINVRIICATNRDLLQMVQEGTFRRDLYYRLNVIPIVLPPLRERQGDIETLVYHFMEYYNQKLKKNIVEISPEAMKLLKSYDWPGNVRELKNVIEYMENIVEGERINVSDLPNTFWRSNLQTTSHRTLTDILENYEKVVLESMVQDADTLEKKDALARRLGISRATLYRKLAYYGM